MHIMHVSVSDPFAQHGGGEYRGGSPTAVQAWQPCPLWEPSPSHTIYYCRL